MHKADGDWHMRCNNNGRNTKTQVFGKYLGEGTSQTRGAAMLPLILTNAKFADSTFYGTYLALSFQPRYEN